MFKPGQKVHYAPKKEDFVQRCENGIVKTVKNESNFWVVYYCSDNWKHYANYIAQLTNIENLADGWVKESNIN